MLPRDGSRLPKYPKGSTTPAEQRDPPAPEPTGRGEQGRGRSEHGPVPRRGFASTWMLFGYAWMDLDPKGVFTVHSPTLRRSRVQTSISCQGTRNPWRTIDFDALNQDRARTRQHPMFRPNRVPRSLWPFDNRERGSKCTEGSGLKEESDRVREVRGGRRVVVAEPCLEVPGLPGADTHRACGGRRRSQVKIDAEFTRASGLDDL